MRAKRFLRSRLGAFAMIREQQPRSTAHVIDSPSCVVIEPRIACNDASRHHEAIVEKMRAKPVETPHREASAPASFAGPRLV